MAEKLALLNTDLAPELVSLAAAGDEAAFTRIVIAHHADMLRIAHVVCGDVDLAADAAQAAWAIAWRRIGTVKDPARLRPWLMSVAANEARQAVRGSGRRRVREIAIASMPRTSEAGRDELMDLANALSRLDPRDRTLLGLHFVAGLDSREMAREVGMSPTAVRSRISRAIGRLRKDLGDE